MNQTTNYNPKTIGRRVARVIAIVGASLAALLVLVVVVLSIPGVRGMVLRRAVKMADGALPGDLAVASASWPKLGTLLLSGVSWTDGADSLLLADDVEVSVDVRALLAKDIKVHDVSAQQVHFDLPALLSRFEKGATGSDVAEPGEGTAGGGFPRAGSVSLIPSVAAEHFEVTASLIRISAGFELRGLRAVGGANFLYGETPLAQIDHLSVRDGAGLWKVDSLRIDVDLQRGGLSGGGSGTFEGNAVVLSLSSPSQDAFRLTLDEASQGQVFAVDGTIERDGVLVRAIAYQLSARVPPIERLQADPLIGRHLADVPPLGAIELQATGTLAFRPTFAVDANIGSDSDAWLRKLQVSFHYGDDGILLDDVVLALAGTTVSGHARINGDRIDAAASLRMSDARALKLLLPDNELPESIAAAVDVAFAKNGARMNADVTGHGRYDEFELDSLQARVEAQGNDHFDLRLLASAAEFNVAVSAEVTVADVISANVAPIIVTTAPIEERSMDVSRDGAVKFDTHTRDITARGLRVIGDTGSARVDAALDSVFAGYLDVVCRWPVPPRLLVKQLDLTPAQIDSLDVMWPDSAALTLHVIGQPGETFVADGSFLLPGPAEVVPLFMPDAQLGDWQLLRGDIGIRGSLHTGVRVSASVDLNASEWIDSSAVVVRVADGVVNVDTIMVAVAGAGVYGSARVDDGFEARARLDVTSPQFARRFVAQLPDILLSGDVEVRRKEARPELTANLEASVKGNGYVAERIVVAAEINAEEVNANITTPSGVRSPRARMDQVDISYSALDPAVGYFPGAFKVHMEGEDLSVHHEMTVDLDDTISFHVDTLGIALFREDLQSQGEFSFHVYPNGGGYRVADLDMGGSVGRVAVHGTMQPDSTRLNIDIAARVPDMPPSLALPANYWPDYVEFNLDAGEDVELDARVEGLILNNREPVFVLHVLGEADSVVIDLALSDSAGTFVDGHALIPAAVTVFPPSLDVHGGALHGSLDLHGLPLQIGPIAPGHYASVDGTVRLSGTSQHPVGKLQTVVAFPDWPKLAPYTVEFDAGFNPVTLEGGEEGVGTLSSSLRMKRGGETLLTGATELPIEVSFEEPFMVADQQREMKLTVSSQSLNLSEFDALLPVAVGLAGTFKIDLDVAGVLENPALAGKITGDAIEVSVAQRADVFQNFNIDIGGTRLASSTKGHITVVQGVIQTPDLPKNLHAVEGESVLMDLDIAPIDTTVLDTLLIPHLPLLTNADVDIGITIPKEFYIRGNGLDVELAGDMRVFQKNGYPLIEGQLRAIRGTLNLLGRTLQLEHGTVQFRGNDEINPSLEISMKTEIADWVVHVHVGGTVQKPKLTMTSDPPLREGDIMAVLLFGRPYQGLNDSEADHLQNRSAEIVASLGAAQLQSLTSQFGVDVVKYEGHDDATKMGSLTVGTYLNPKVLLSYVYSLDQASESFVSVEYFVKGRFKVESMYGRRNQSAVGLGWATDY